MENQLFPSFVTFNNATNTISYRPSNNTMLQGLSFYYSVVLKQTHSDYIMNIYYITVKFTGTPYVAPLPDTSGNATDNNTFSPFPVNFTVSDFDWKSKGQLVFSIPVNMTSIVANWNDFFLVYVDCRTRNITEEILIFEVTSVSKDNMSLNFTVTFKFPYLLGLLNKKQDYLSFQLQNMTDLSPILFNATNNTFNVNLT